MTVLVGYIPNALGEAALTAGLAESRRRAEPILVVNMSRDDVLVDAHRAAAEELERVRRDLAEADAIGVEVRRIEEGNDPAQVLLDIAESEDVSVIVIGMRRRSPVGKLILGSIAQRVLLDAPCPVLSVKSA